MALDILGEFPDDEIFVIPVRIEECEPEDEQLQEIHRADLFPSYEKGLRDILRVLWREESPPQKEVDKKEFQKSELTATQLKNQTRNNELGRIPEVKRGYPMTQESQLTIKELKSKTLDFFRDRIERCLNQIRSDQLLVHQSANSYIRDNPLKILKIKLFYCVAMGLIPHRLR